MKINREELVIGYIATLVAGVLFALGPLGNDLTKEMAITLIYSVLFYLSEIESESFLRDVDREMRYSN